MPQPANAMTTLSMWVIYANPRDFPGKHVVRRHVSRADGTYGATDEFEVADTLDETREFVPGWAIRLDRQPEDDPVIVETWI